jgi:hypothetical protein
MRFQDRMRNELKVIWITLRNNRKNPFIKSLVKTPVRCQNYIRVIAGQIKA